MDRRPRTNSGRHTTRRDLQIAVLGDSIVGLAIGVLLQKRGFDPVIATNPNRQPQSQVATIWNAGQRILKAISIYEGLETAGSRLERLYVHSGTEEDGVREVVPTFLEYPHPIVVSTAELVDRLRDQLDADGKTAARVTDLHPQSDSVTVQFETGVQEGFDLVVDPRPPGPTERGGTHVDCQKTTALQQHEIPVPPLPALRDTALEGWVEDVFLQWLPSVPPQNHALLRATTSRQELDLPALVDRWRKSVMDAGIELESGDFEPLDRVGDRRSVVVGKPPRESYQTDRRVRLGPKAWLLPPASGLAVSLGIEDAWVLADELGTGSADPTAIGQRHEGRRQKRCRAIRKRTKSAETTHSYPIPVHEPARTIGRFRSAALGSFCSGALTGLQEVLSVNS